MGWLLLAYVLVAWVLTGLGRLARRLLGGGGSQRAGLLSWWLGWAVALIFVQCWNTLLPVGWPAALGLSVAGAAGWWVTRPGAGELRSALRSRLVLLVLLGALPLTWVVARLALGGIGNGDSSIYHLPAMRWAQAGAVEPGLANLNPLLGLQSSFYSFLGLLDWGPWVDRSQHVGPSVLVWMLLVQVWWSSCELARARARYEPVAVFSVLLLPIAVDQLLTHDLVSGSADLPVAVMSAVVLLALVASVEADPGSRRAAVAQVLVLCAAGCTLKLSFLAVGAGVSLAALASARAELPGKRVLALGCLLAVLGPGIWSLRSVVLTGYPAFPATVLAFPVEWRMPLADAQRVGNFVVGWGRLAGDSPKPLLNSWAWVGPWVRSTLMMNRAVVLPLALALGLGLGVGLRGLRTRRGDALWVALLPALGGLGFWFFTSPDLRFAAALFWVIPALLGAMLLRGASPPALALGLAIAVGIAAMPLERARFFPVASLWTLAPAPTPVLGLRVTRSGLQVAVPDDGGCWSTRRLCSPWASPALQARDSADPARGFVLTLGEHIAFDDPQAPLRFPDLR